MLVRYLREATLAIETNSGCLIVRADLFLTYPLKVRWREHQRKSLLNSNAELAQDEGVIENFRHKGLARFFEDNDCRKVPVSQLDKIARILARLNEPVTVHDMGLPGAGFTP